MSFEALGLSADLLRAVREQGYSEATPVQAQAIPAILQGQDILAGAQTGTGKTAGFTLPVLQRLGETQQSGRPASHRAAKNCRPVRALILAPTRELANQVEQSVRAYGKYTQLYSMAIFGGVKIGPQISKLRRGVDVVVATPGRLLDLVDQREIDLSHIDMLVLDEADRMLDMGFIPAIRRIVSLLPERRQTLFFSATYSAEVKKLADSILRSPTCIEVARGNTTAENVSQRVHPVDSQRKRQLLSELIGGGNWRQVLVFTRTKRGADRLATQLIGDGLAATAIHGDKTQGARNRALSDFKRGKARVLVATDVAARGLDIDHLPYVVNYDLPMVAEDYVHRIGRTGRAGNSGEAISFVCAEERNLLHNIERLLKREVKREIVPGYEPDFRLQATDNARRPHKSSQSRTSRGDRPTAAGRKKTDQTKSTQGRSDYARPGQPAVRKARPKRNGSAMTVYTKGRASATKRPRSSF
jgi:ATP-dependent RNA helicase RhlE